MQTITTLAELETFLEANESRIDAGELFFRWSHGPERDAANGWISRCYAVYDDETGMQMFEADGSPVTRDEDGLSAARVYDADVKHAMLVIKAWLGEVWGETGYFLTGTSHQVCGDEEPLVDFVEPLAIIDYKALTA